jgi:hypothetical protein
MKYGLKMRVIALVTVISMMFSVTYASAADWVGDWVNSYTYTGPSSFHGSNRTYLNGGSFHARWGDTGVEPVFTSQAPKFKAGCGGIDAFMGSFAFLDFGRLVQKFKKMSTGAVAAFAFDIALNVLCTPCSNALKALEALSNSLNSLQMGDCMSVKDIKASISNFGTQMNNAAEAGNEALADANSGWTGGDWKDSWDKVKSSGAAAIGMNPDGTWADITSDCNQTVKTYFQEEGSTLSLFVADNSQTILASDSATGTELLRGYIGDLYIEPKSNGIPEITPQPVCQSSFNIDEFIDGKYKIQTIGKGNKCADASASGTFQGVAYTGGLLGMTDKMLKLSVSELKTPTAMPSAAVGKFISQVPSIPIAFIIWYSWSESGSDQAYVESRILPFKHDIAKILAYSALSNLFETAYKTSRKGWNILDLAMQAKSGKSTGSASSTASTAPTQGGIDPDKCRVDVYKESITTMGNWLNGEGTKSGTFAILEKGIKNANDSKMTVEQKNNFSAFTDKWDAMKKEVRERLGGSVYSRATKGT